MNKKQLTELNHLKWLAKMGYTSKPKSLRVNPNKLPNLREGLRAMPPTSDSVGNGYKKANNSYSGSSDIVVGQAYNKGNFVVLSKEDAANPATGKRRS